MGQRSKFKGDRQAGGWGCNSYMCTLVHSLYWSMNITDGGVARNGF